MFNLHVFLIFFFNDTATTEIYTLSLHDALPILRRLLSWIGPPAGQSIAFVLATAGAFWVLSQWQNNTDDIYKTTEWVVWKFTGDRKSTRLNSSHANISYAVFCLKKKNKKNTKIL